MTKREKIRLIKSVWRYLQDQIETCYATKNEALFDWYSEGQGVYWQILNDLPISIITRVKPL